MPGRFLISSSGMVTYSTGAVGRAAEPCRVECLQQIGYVRGDCIGRARIRLAILLLPDLAAPQFIGQPGQRDQIKQGIDELDD